MAKLIDLTGMKFGRLTVICRSKERSKSGVKWHCSCECGNTTESFGSNLRRGAESCGCVSQNRLISRNATHGMTRSPEYSSWNSMVTRCTNPNRRGYKKYSQLGICDEWRKSFSAFMLDMGYRPGPGYSIERINNNKGYFPENCKWATRKEQNSNKSTNILITCKGVTKTADEWSTSIGGHRCLVRDRLARGWLHAKAVSTPPRKYRSHSTQ